ncbi:hypothetical protein [Gemmobacter sp. 24YEA27]|uniref:hypothetical protein n=1 Tax=Gemmobacter sp. 24YEA27 TaxID=3040672 RepID=UPI0024B3426A|nr:hypothetical protein [Gemmobacter sp. 24YEA27]
MDDRVQLYVCENCGRSIHEGEKYQPADDANFCEEHAATLADILAFWEGDVADQSGDAYWPDEFESLEDAQEHVAELRERVARDGADFKPLREA